jgi:hypothetical protein
MIASHSQKINDELAAKGLDLSLGVSVDAYDSAVVAVFERADSTEEDRTAAAFAKTGNVDLERRFDAALAAFLARRAAAGVHPLPPEVPDAA